MRDGRFVARRRRPRRRRPWSGRARASSTSAGGPSRPGFGDSHVHPVSSGVDKLHCDLMDSSGIDEYLERIATYAAANPDVAVDPGRRLVPRPLPRRPRAPRGPRPRRPRSAGVPAQQGRARRVGQQPGAGARRASPPTRPTPTTGASPATRTARRWARSTRARRTWWSASSHRRRPRSASRRCSRARRTSTASGSRTGRTRSSTPEIHATYRSVAGRGALTARVAGALWWEHDGGLDQIEGLVARRAEGPVGRYSVTSVKLMLDGIVENYTAAMLDPYFDHDGAPTGQPGHGLHRPRGPRAGGAEARCARVPGPLPRPRRPRRSPRARRRRGRAPPERLVRHAPAPRPPPARPPRRHPALPPARGRWPTSRRCGPCTRGRWTS